MFDIGFSELLLVGVVALVVLGPERLPRAARTAGLWVGRARAALTRYSGELERELRAEELHQSLREEARRLESAAAELRAAGGSPTPPAAAPRPAPARPPPPADGPRDGA